MTRYTLEEAKYILGLLAGKESGFTTATQTRDAARTVLEYLAEEPEWEYARMLDNGNIFHPAGSDDADLGVAVRRRKAGPWVPVEN